MAPSADESTWRAAPAFYQHQLFIPAPAFYQHQLFLPTTVGIYLPTSTSTETAAAVESTPSTRPSCTSSSSSSIASMYVGQMMLKEEGTEKNRGKEKCSDAFTIDKVSTVSTVSMVRRVVL